MYSRFNNNKPMKVNATQAGDPKWKVCAFLHSKSDAKINGMHNKTCREPMKMYQ